MTVIPSSYDDDDDNFYDAHVNDRRRQRSHGSDDDAFNDRPGRWYHLSTANNQLCLVN